MATLAREIRSVQKWLEGPGTKAVEIDGARLVIEQQGLLSHGEAFHTLLGYVQRLPKSQFG